MNFPQFNDILSLSNREILDEIIIIEEKIFKLRFKKATQQTFKSHELKNKIHKLGQLKTLLNIRLKK